MYLAKAIRGYAPIRKTWLSQVATSDPKGKQELEPCFFELDSVLSVWDACAAGALLRDDPFGASRLKPLCSLTLQHHPMFPHVHPMILGIDSVPTIQPNHVFVKTGGFLLGFGEFVETRFREETGKLKLPLACFPVPHHTSLSPSLSLSRSLSRSLSLSLSRSLSLYIYPYITKKQVNGYQCYLLKPHHKAKLAKGDG